MVSRGDLLITEDLDRSGDHMALAVHMVASGILMVDLEITITDGVIIMAEVVIITEATISRRKRWSAG